MGTNQRKKMKISLMIPFLVFILFFTIMIWQKYRSSQEVPVPQPELAQEGNRFIILFFVSEGAHLARETRRLEPCKDDNACLKIVLGELLNGPVGKLEEPVPEGASVNAVHIEGSQVTVDFNSLFSENMMSGSSAEMLAVYSVVNTIAVNFPYIQKVQITIDGKTGAVLRHLDLSDPLQPDYSLEQLPAIKTEKTDIDANTTSKGAHQ